MNNLTRLMMCQLLDSAEDVVSGEWRYAWREVNVDTATGEVEEVVGGRSGTVVENYAVIPGGVELPIDPLDPPETPYQIFQRGYVENVMTWWVFATPLGVGKTDYVTVWSNPSTLGTRDVRVAEAAVGTTARQLIVEGVGTGSSPTPLATHQAVLGAKVEDNNNDFAAHMFLLCAQSSTAPYVTGYQVWCVGAPGDGYCTLVSHAYRFYKDIVDQAQGSFRVSYDSGDNVVYFDLLAFASPTPDPALEAVFRVNGQPTPTLVAPNIWTGENQFTSSSPTDTPVTIMRDPAQTANLFVVQGLSETVGVNAAGHFFGSGLFLTNLNAAQLVTGIIPAARIGVVDGGTW